MIEHAVVIAGAGPTGLMLAGELALASVDVGIVERRASQDLIGSRAGGLHSRTIEVLDQRGIADRFLSQGQVAQVERHPVGARVLRNTMASVALRQPDGRTKTLRDTIAELLGMDEPRRRLAAEMSGLGIHYDLGHSDLDKRHPLLGRRMPDLDLISADGSLRVFTLLHDARPVTAKPR